MTGGFLNGYGQQEVVVIDECPMHWADYHLTIKMLLSTIDSYEGFINIKGNALKKKTWRWIFVSNYEPSQVFSPKPVLMAGVPVQQPIDVEGVFEPFYNRFTSDGEHPERILCAVNEPTKYPAKFRIWNWHTNGLDQNNRNELVFGTDERINHE